MITLFISLLISSPGTMLKDGGLPPMLLNPDTVVAETSSGLSSNLGGIMDNVVALPGAVFGLGVVDLESGERITRNAQRRFYIDKPDIVNAVVCVERHNSGELRLDSLIARNEQLWQVVKRGQQGARAATQSLVYYIGGMEHIDNWLESSGYSSTTKFNGIVEEGWDESYDYEPNYTTVSDCLDFMEIVSEALDVTAVRRMTTNPPLSGELEVALGSSNVVYGWISGREDTRCINLIISKPDGSRYGVTVLSNDLCCPAKADLGFSMIWDAL